MLRKFIDKRDGDYSLASVANTTDRKTSALFNLEGSEYCAPGADVVPFVHSDPFGPLSDRQRALEPKVKWNE
jgi:hypothetical protein